MLSFTILTCEACDGVRDLHTRMPVMLGENGFEPWLAGESPMVEPISKQRSRRRRCRQR